MLIISGALGKIKKIGIDKNNSKIPGNLFTRDSKNSLVWNWSSIQEIIMNAMKTNTVHLKYHLTCELVQTECILFTTLPYQSPPQVLFNDLVRMDSTKHKAK